MRVCFQIFKVDESGSSVNYYYLFLAIFLTHANHRGIWENMCLSSTTRLLLLRLVVDNKLWPPYLL